MASQFEKVVGTRLQTYKDRNTGAPILNCVISTQTENVNVEGRISNAWGLKCSEYWIRSDHDQYQEALQLKDKDYILPIMNGKWCNGFLVKGKV